MAKKTKPTQDLLAQAIGQAVNQFKIDSDLAYVKGVAYDIGGVTLLVKHGGTSNRDYFKAMKDIAEEHKLKTKGLEAESPEYNKVSQELMAQVYVDSVIAGVSVNGVKQPWDKDTKQAIADMLCAIPEKFDELVVFASQIDNYRAAARKDAEKN